MFDSNEYFSVESIIIFASVILIAIGFLHFCDLGYSSQPEQDTRCYYSYGSVGGPMMWKERFPEAGGNRQSPINIGTPYAIVICAEHLQPLEFSPEYYANPARMRLYNDGHSVTVSACWENHICPKIYGGPLKSPYRLLNIRTHWGPNDEEGSEHIINSRRYALEMQALYVISTKCFKGLNEALAQKGVLIMSYLFQVGSRENPNLTPLVNGLRQIRPLYADVDINPMPISCLLPAFRSKYYLYSGSLTIPPCTEGVIWMVQSEPICISSRQVKNFRKVTSIDGPLESNTRPTQDLNSRKIFYYD